MPMAFRIPSLLLALLAACSDTTLPPGEALRSEALTWVGSYALHAAEGVDLWLELGADGGFRCDPDGSEDRAMAGTWELVEGELWAWADTGGEDLAFAARFEPTREADAAHLRLLEPGDWLREQGLARYALFMRALDGSGPTRSEFVVAGPAAELVGSWWMGDGLGYNLRLRLGADGTFKLRWTGCLGVYGSCEGLWDLEGELVQLRVESWTPDMDHPPGLRRLDHAGEVRLLNLAQMDWYEEYGPDDFCSFTRVGDA